MPESGTLRTFPSTSVEETLGFWVDDVLHSVGFMIYRELDHDSFAIELAHHTVRKLADGLLDLAQEDASDHRNAISRFTGVSPEAALTLRAGRDAGSVRVEIEMGDDSLAAELSGETASELAAQLLSIPLNV
ncbi:hypothetical protein [Streptomyces sp. MP131-18]|uniref:hypothetical protein n=1 Tax=Streptomyces sp. MP131-18 TaxID=1857892 RepID=UPI00097BAEE0|nr:hypothetical protein [Streptomyces sp. MP131-18]ONK13238.1 hypothetical protein STBA_40010 [Streptomyces sp. MP131-18]